MALLTIDAIVNLLLGIVLILTPFGMLRILGLPSVENYFYTTILGCVIFGIGVALLVELLGEHKGMQGLGVAGAIAINICGGSALLYWLLLRPFNLPFRGELSL